MAFNTFSMFHFPFDQLEKNTRAANKKFNKFFTVSHTKLTYAQN